MQICSVPSCPRPISCRGLCVSHYSRWKRHGDPLADVPLGHYAPRESICAIPTCTRSVYRRNLCHSHAERLRKHGNVDADRPIRAHNRPIDERFWDYVDQTGGPDACWPWLAYKNPDGYGIFGLQGTQLIGAHRLVFLLTQGPIPQGKLIGHTCHIDLCRSLPPPCSHHACCNPKHIQAMSRRDMLLHKHSQAGLQTAAQIHAQNVRARTHCKKGHAFDSANTIKEKDGTRRCKACQSHRSRENCRRRRANKAQAPRNDLTYAQWLEIQAAFDHRCAYCQQRCEGQLTQDHITPYAKNGSNTLWNVVPACLSCNMKKNAGPVPKPIQPLLLTIAPYADL